MSVYALEVAIIKAVKDITLDFVWSGSGGDSGSVWVHSGVFEVVVVVVIVAVCESTVVCLKW